MGSSRFYGHDETASEIEIGWTFLVRSLRMKVNFD